MSNRLILMGPIGQRVVFDPDKLECVEEIKGGLRLHMSCGAEIDAWGLTIELLREKLEVLQ